MRNLRMVLILSYLIFLSNEMFCQITFEKVYFVPGGEMLTTGYYPTFIKQTLNDDYIIAGARGVTIETSNTFIMKINASGDTIMSKTINQSGARNIIQTSDGGYLITTAAQGFNYGHDLYLIKTDSMADTIWTKSIGSGDIFDYTMSTGLDTKETEDGYITVGITDAYGAGDDDIYFIKHDLNGNTAWLKTIGSSGSERVNQIERTNDGGFIICGSTYSAGAGSYDVLLVKTDSTGYPVWAKTYGAAGNDSPVKMSLTNNNRFIVTGYSTSFDAQKDVFIICTDSTGTLLWTKTIGNSLQDRGSDIISLDSGGCVVTGSTQDTATSLTKVLLARLNTNGDTIWTKSYGDSLSSSGAAIFNTNDGGYFIAAQRVADYGSGYNNNLYFIKTDSSGNTSCNNSNSNVNVTSVIFATSDLALQLLNAGGVTNSLSYCNVSNAGLKDSLICPLTTERIMLHNKVYFQVYPNPSDEYFNVCFSNPSNKMHRIKIFTMTGQLVKQINDIKSKQIIIDREGLKSGVYLLQLSNDDAVIGKVKLILN